MRRTFRYIVVKEERTWLAMCIDYNLIGCSMKSSQKAVDDLKEMILADVEVAKEVGTSSHIEEMEPTGWFEECHGWSPTTHPVHTLTVEVP